ncbi:hypothetical protein [uncultured Dialister sp.]|uniref:hypothetical protein n=1 Tax=uncultured Dialister sp. TaxID=278064 RepID=UPI0026DD6A93|nr:hypothetical protein [uncultured Dialister sp.]
MEGEPLLFKVSFEPSEGLLFSLNFIEGKFFREGQEGADDFSAPSFGKGGNPLLPQKGHEAPGGKAEGEVLEIRRNEPFFAAELGEGNVVCHGMTPFYGE